MQAIHFKSRFYKVLSILVLYALILDLSIPTAMAVGRMRSGFRTALYGVRHYSIPSQPRAKVQTEAIVQTAHVAKITTAAAVSASGGPGQTDNSGFSLNSQDGIINKFTGDMNYSIPLMDVEGFPISISYNPNVTMEQEASWVGLGWDLSLGSINREMRGIPDDFAGDKVSRIFKTSDETTDGFSIGPGITIGTGIGLGKNFRYKVVGVSMSSQLLGGRYISNYTGVGHTLDLSATFSANLLGVNANGGLGFSMDNQNGLGRSSSYGFGASGSLLGASAGFDYGHSQSINSRDGMKSVTSNSGKSAGFGMAYAGIGVSSQKGSIQTFGVQTYVPRFQFDRTGTGNKTNSSFGVSVMTLLPPIFANARLSTAFYHDLSKLTALDHSLPAYGYYHLSQSKNNPDAMLDFNREGAGQVNKYTRHLGFASVTQDMYYCNAPGLGSSYRAHRYEAFKLNDPDVSSKYNSESATTDIMIAGGVVPAGTLIGVDVSRGKGTSIVNSSTGTANQSSHFSFVNPAETFDQKEYYLKSTGEMTPVDLGLLTSYQGETPASLELVESNGTVIPTGNLSTSTGTYALPGTNKALSRPDNIIHYRELTGADMENYGIPILNYGLFSCGRIKDDPSPPTVVPAVSITKPAHMVAAVEITNESGMRYFFGIPCYSYQQKEVSFSASGLKDIVNYTNTGLIQYQSNDNTIFNDKGRQQMYDATTVPGYASAFLLTNMFSTDYIDRTGDGATPDDQGNYYKLNYTNLYTDTNRFNWRMPMTGGNPAATDFSKRPNLAFFQENLEVDPWDDAANYIYGEKDLWYGQSVESKHFIAYFCLEDRIDMFSSAGENSGLNTDNPGKYLKRIELYSRADLARDGSSAKPIQVVEFEYDYSLCQDYVGNKNSHGGYYPITIGQGTGKLTLKRIYSYSGNSGELKTIPIQFEYSDGELNPDYSFNSSDRWGNYKPNDFDTPNHIFPYATQDPTQANTNIQAWKLKKVKESSGAEMEFFYEADSYSYVQNERAMRMFNITGLSDTETLNDLAEVANPNEADLIVHGVHQFFRDPTEKKDYCNVIYFKLETALDMSKSDAYEVVIKNYFTDASGQIPDNFIFNMHSKLGKETDDRFETVQSTAALAKGLQGGSYIGVVGESGPFEYGFVVIEADKINENADHYYVTSLQRANWQFARLNAPFTIYGTPDYSASTPEEFCDYSNSLDYRVLFKADINKKINRLQYGNEFQRERSFIRLFEPDNVKYGGNARLVAVQYNDGWNSMSTEDESSYRWNYSYAGKGDKIPAGVAAYEPKVGGDENPLYQMSAYTVDRFSLPDEKSYQFLPLAEMLFPAPVVGYSEVVTQFGDTEISPAKSVGKSIERFYTAKDYRTVVKNTEGVLLKKDRTEDNAIKEDGKVTELMGFSEGFVVITNDFHGKIKETEVYDAGGTKLSASKYNYYDPNTGRIKYLHKDGTITESVTPREIDVYTESWKTKNTADIADKSNTASVAVTITATVPPIPIPYVAVHHSVFGAEINSEVQGFTFEKVINHSAVLESVESYYLGSSNTAQNELIDPHSGAVLLSSLKDEFDDNLYSFSYPAHWKYSTFLNMNQTDNALFSDISGTDNVISVSSALGLKLTVGDKLAVYTAGVFVTDAWVLEISGANAKLIDAAGEPLSGISWATSEIRVLRTGKKNILSGDMMSISTKVNPIGTSGEFTFPETEIISSSASMFLENRSVPCTQVNGVNTISAYLSGVSNTTDYEVDEKINPFLNGTMGNYRPFTGFSFQNERTNFEDPNGIRNNGTLKNYIPFYKRGSSGEWYAFNEFGHPNYAAGHLGNWRKLGQVEEYSEWGTATQASDQLKIGQSGISAINRDLIPVQSASSVNASVREIGFDGFEIYNDSHGGSAGVASTQFSLSPAFSTGSVLSTSERHSGYYSMEVAVSSHAEYTTYAGPPEQQENIDEDAYLVRACNCISNFAPTAEKEYFVSVWVKENSGSVPYTHTRVVVEYEDAGGEPTGDQQIFTPDGAIIEGWQKIEGKYTVPAGTAKIRFFFVNTDAGSSYFDDFRTHPFLAGMTSVVYDQSTLQPIAEHDGYNYTTFYNYDENHQLVRIKVETIEGIKTISETETGTKRQ